VKVPEGLREAAAPLGMAGGALAVCCTIHLIILAGGVGAATGILGGALRSPYVIVAGLGLLTAALAVLVIRRTKPGTADSCCAPEPADHRHDLASTVGDRQEG
jgi:hypothetical protein